MDGSAVDGIATDKSATRNIVHIVSGSMAAGCPAVDGSAAAFGPAADGSVAGDVVTLWKHDGRQCDGRQAAVRKVTS